MKYRSGYKYQLAADETILLPDIPLVSGKVLKAPRGYDIDTQFIRLTPEGKLTAKNGYAYDGPSGPTLDSKYCMRGPLYHDEGYQLMREKRLPLEFRPYFDALMYIIILEDGYKMVDHWGHIEPIKTIEKKAVKARVYVWYQAVYGCAESAALPENDRIVYDTEAL